MRPIDAAEAVAREFVGEENGKLRELLDSGILAFAFREAEQDTIHSDPLYAGGGDHHPSDTLGPRETPVRTRYDTFFSNPYDAVVPVPGTGERKRLGDWTRDDLVAVARWYGRIEKTAQHKRRRFKRVAEIVGAERTVQEAWSEITEDDRKLITLGS